jgi:hypothetical protein
VTICTDVSHEPAASLIKVIHADTRCSKCVASCTLTYGFHLQVLPSTRNVKLKAVSVYKFTAYPPINQTSAVILFVFAVNR